MFDKLLHMWHAFQVGKRFEEPDFGDIELLLQSSLVPVTPRPQYLRELNRRLTHDSPTTLGNPEPKTFHYFLIGLASLVSGMLLVILGVRTVAAILVGLGVYAPLHRQTQAKDINSPVRPTA